jgi:hypothetical protein
MYDERKMKIGQINLSLFSLQKVLTSSTTCRPDFIGIWMSSSIAEIGLNFYSQKFAFASLRKLIAVSDAIRPSEQ